MIIQIQYYDTQGNPVPYYITREINIYGYSRIDNTIRVTRKITCSSNMYMQINTRALYPNATNVACLVYCFFKEGDNVGYVTCEDIVENQPVTDGYHFPTTYTNRLEYKITGNLNQLSNAWFKLDGQKYVTYNLTTGWTSQLQNTPYTTNNLLPVDTNIYQNTGFVTLTTNCSFMPVPAGYRYQSDEHTFSCWADFIWECYDRLVNLSDYFGPWKGGGAEIDTGGGGDFMIGPGVKSGLFSVYVPTDFNMSRFSQWLWAPTTATSFFDETQLKKLFQDPMECVLNFHALFIDITGTSNSTIHLGNIDSNIGCPFTTDTIRTLSCGSVSIGETFNNAMDYSPYTQVELYLPYIGFRPLKIEEVMNADVSVSYKIDITTGACVALISITKGGVNIVSYAYSGNCSIPLPMTASNAREIFGALTSTVLSVGTAVATGGATAGLALGAVGNALSARTHVERAGSLTGSTGMLGGNKPYIILTKPVPAMATNYEEYSGYPTNQLVLLSNCSGYTRVKDCHLSVAGATAEEVNEIETLLKKGVEI